MTDSVRPVRWRFVPRTIRGLAILFAALSGLVTIILGATTLILVHHEMELQIDQRIDIETDALLEYEREHGFEALVSFVANRDKRAKPGSIGYLAGVDDREARAMGYIVTDRTGRRRAGTLRAQIPPPGWSEHVRIVRPDGSQSEAQVLNSALRNGGRLIVAGDRAALYEIDVLILRLFATVFGLLMLWGALMVILFGRIIRRQLAAIERSANLIIAGDMSQRMPLYGSGAELDRLSILLNRMLDQIGQLVENLRAVSSGLAHDLRTPLSRLRAKLEKAAALSDNPAQRELMDTAMGESDDLLALFAGMLAIAEIDSKRIRNRFAPVDLSAAVVEIGEAYRPDFEDAGMVLLLLDVRPAWVSGDRHLLQRLVANLLDNVLRHAKGATTVELTVGNRNGMASVTVADDGPGVPLSEHERVFDRLVRLDSSRSTPGHGLGLSMVAAIASAHEGKVRVLPSEQGMIVEFAMAALAQPANPL